MSAAGNSPHARAALLMLGSTAFFAAMAVAIRVASESLPTFGIAFFRNLFGLLFLLPLMVWPGAGLPRTRQLPRYLLRCVVGVCSMLCGFWALGHLPMAQAVALSYATPLFATVAAVFILGETVRARRWSAVAIGLVGVLVIVRPGTAEFSLGTLVALCGALLAALVAIQIKQLTRSDPADTIVFYTYVFWVPISLVPALFAWQWPQGSEWAWLVLVGACGTGGQLLWTRALQIGEVSALQPIGFLQLPMVAMAAWLLFGEAPAAWTLAGAGLILAANVYIAHREVQLSRRASTTAPAAGAKPGE